MSIIGNGVIEVDPTQVSLWLAQDDILLVDVRESEEWEEERIEGAVLYPMSDFDSATFPDSRGKRVVVMCKAGMRSLCIARKMLEHGHASMFNLSGGIRAWKQALLPIVQGEELPPNPDIWVI